MNNLIDKKALIIGASGGMGSAVASMLSKRFFQVVLHMETLVLFFPVIFQILLKLSNVQKMQLKVLVD